MKAPAAARLTTSIPSPSHAGEPAVRCARDASHWQNAATSSCRTRPKIRERLCSLSAIAFGTRLTEASRGAASEIVILSPKFFKKNWSQWELDGLVARENASGEKAILPIWHGSQGPGREVFAFSY